MNRFVPTSIFAEIEDGVRYARTWRRAVVIQGPAGIGKTMALKRIAAANRDEAYLLRVAFPQRQDKAAVNSIADTLGIYTQKRTMRQIWGEVESTAEELGACGHFLMIDEAQVLDLNMMKELVDLPSERGLPVILCGNDQLLKRTRAVSAAWDQIASRCGKRVALTKPQEQDLISIAIDFDVVGSDARNAIVSYGFQTSIRELVQLLEAGRDLAGKGPLTLNILRTAVVTIRGSLSAVRLLKSA